MNTAANTDPAQALVPQLDAIFNARSVAIVGLPRGEKAGKLFLIALKDTGFPGKIYPVNPEAGEIDGLKAYPGISAIPGPVDLAIILTPPTYTLTAVKECVAKGVKGVVLFTAGYKELGTAEGKAMEEALVRAVRSSGTRLFGPNCMGLYCPKTGLSFFPDLSKTPGPVGFISHSGSMANIVAHLAPQKGIAFSKAISLGNECDLTCADLLIYLAKDADTGVIGAYVEGIKDGPYFLDALKKASQEKPVILWKVALTPEGGRAASSHTGALGGSREIWEAVVRQGGAIPVTGFDDLMDALLGFSFLPSGLGDRIAILSGPGGFAVAAAEACGNAGLRLAELSPQTRSTLAEFVPPTGTSLRNPVDVGLTAALNMEIYAQAARAVAADPGVDAVAIIGRGMTSELNRLYTEAVVRARNEYQKPFLAVSIPGFDQEIAQGLFQKGVPFFHSAERAMGVYARVRQYQIWHQKFKIPSGGTHGGGSEP